MWTGVCLKSSLLFPAPVSSSSSCSSSPPSVSQANVTATSPCRHFLGRSLRLRLIFSVLLIFVWIDSSAARSVTPLSQLLSLRRLLGGRDEPFIGSTQDVDFALASGLVSKRTVSDPNDPPRIMCGQTLINNLKKQCGARGTFSPNWKRSYGRQEIQTARDDNDADSGFRLQKRYDDLCSVYLQYEPDSPLSQCCCLGCTNAYLEGFCAEK
nr:unnamed protein product [Spirometra erinaceieuropaei]